MFGFKRSFLTQPSRPGLDFGTIPSMMKRTFGHRRRFWPRWACSPNWCSNGSNRSGRRPDGCQPTGPERKLSGCRPEEHAAEKIPVRAASSTRPGGAAGGAIRAECRGDRADRRSARAALLDRLDLEAIFLYEKHPAEFRRLRDCLGDDAAADLLLHWREYFGLKRADETDRGILIAEIARLSPIQQRGSRPRYPSVLPLILADPPGVDRTDRADVRRCKPRWQTCCRS